jgi:hypothetical protein
LRFGCRAHTLPDMTPQDILERRDRHAAILADLDKQRHSAITADSGGSVRWAMASGVTVNSGGIALLASRSEITMGDQWAMSLLVLSVAALLLAGWSLARSGVSEAGLIHLSLTQRHCEGADLSAESEELWDTMIRQDAVAGYAGATSLVALLVGGLLGIWL